MGDALDLRNCHTALMSELIVWLRGNHTACIARVRPNYCAIFVPITGSFHYASIRADSRHPIWCPDFPADMSAIIKQSVDSLPG